jgi:hypothetical protein
MAASGGWQGMVQQGIQQQSKSGSSGGSSSGSGGMGGRLKKASSSAGKAMQDWANIESSNAGKISDSIQPVRYKKGGRVGKSKRKNRAVPIIAHENERVIPADKRKKVERLMKRAGMTLTDKKRKKDKRKKDRKDAGRS